MSIGMLGTHITSQTLSAGNPSFASQSIVIFNPNNNNSRVAVVSLNTRYGSLRAYVPPRNNLEMAVEVKEVVDYDGCYITFLQ